MTRTTRSIRTTRPRTAAAFIAATALVGGLAACSSGDDEVAALHENAAHYVVRARAYAALEGETA